MPTSPPKSGNPKAKLANPTTINEPAIIWADEPTGDLDSETAQGIMDLLFELNERNKQTFIIVTHSKEIGDQCNRIVTMRDGLVVDDGVDAV